jgi:hypothetical protein
MCRGRAKAPRRTASGGGNEAIKLPGQPLRDRRGGGRVVTHEEDVRSDLRPPRLPRPSSPVPPLPLPLLQ